MLRGQEDYAFNLSEYMVMLDKPLGLAVALDPVSGEVGVVVLYSSTKGQAVSILLPVSTCRLLCKMSRRDLLLQTASSSK